MENENLVSASHQSPTCKFLVSPLLIGIIRQKLFNRIKSLSHKNFKRSAIHWSLFFFSGRQVSNTKALCSVNMARHCQTHYMNNS